MSIEERPPVPEPAAHEDLRPQFHRELDDIRARIAKLGAGVVEAIPRATEILLSQDLEGAEYLLQADKELDQRVLELEERCYQVLARQSPVARDLREVVSALRILAEIERSGDLAVNVCKAARRMYGHPLDPTLRGIIQKMGDQAQHLFKEAIEAYLVCDAPRAAALDDMDGYLDDLQHEFVQAIYQTESSDKLELQVAVQLAVVARFYERIGDHAVNIGERVRYVVEGWGEPGRGATHTTRPAASDLD